jgi:hypothetical protein
VKAARSIDDKKILDNETNAVIFPTHTAVMRLY